MQYRRLYVGRPDPWTVVGRWLAVALGIPLLVLALGGAFVWAFSGFGVKRRTA